MKQIRNMTPHERAALYARFDPDKILALKVCHGGKLERKEYALARRLGYLVVDGGYASYLAQYYEDGAKRGLLCSHVAATREPRQPLRKLVGEPTACGSVCLLGIHACDVDPARLTPANRAWLRAHGWADDQWGTSDRHQTPQGRP